MATKLIPLAAMERVLKEAGADRVSEGSKEALKDVVEDYALEISKQAVNLSHHAGRKTVKDSDVKLAAKNYR